MNKLLLLALALVFTPHGPAHAEDPAYFKAGPLSLTVPLKTVRATYMYDFNANQNLVGGETPFARLFDRVEGTFGAVTSLEGQGTPFVGGNVLLGNVLERYIALPPDLAIGGFGGWNFNTDAPIYGLKASVKIW